MEPMQGYLHRTKVTLMFKNYFRLQLEPCEFEIRWFLQRNATGYLVRGVNYDGTLMGSMQFHPDGSLKWKASEHYPDLVFPDFVDFCRFPNKKIKAGVGAIKRKTPHTRDNEGGIAKQAHRE